MGIHWQKIDFIGQVVGSLDRRDIRIHEDRGDPFILERLDSLTAGVIELSGLADLQGTAAEDKDLLIALSHNHPDFRISKADVRIGRRGSSRRLAPELLQDGIGRCRMACTYGECLHSSHRWHSQTTRPSPRLKPLGPRHSRDFAR